MNATQPLTFMSLLNIHQEMNELYVSHLEELTAVRLAESARWLKQFARKIDRHIEVEDGLLLPLYRERSGKIEGGDTELFLAEHRRIQWFIRQLSEDLAALKGDSPGLRREMLVMLEREFMFKHLLEHHGLRERNILYPTLDRVTSDEEKARLLAEAETIMSRG